MSIMRNNNIDSVKQRFSIRKITIGAVSVLIGLTFMGYSSQTVHADSVDANSSDSATTSVIKDQTTTEQVASTTKTSNNSDKTDTTSSIVVDTNDANKTEDTTSIVKTKSTNKVDLSNTDLTTKTLDEVKSDTTAKNNSIDDNSNVGSSIESKNKIATNENKQESTTSTNKQATIVASTSKTQANTTQNSQYNTADWDGSLDQNSHQYTLTKYKGTDNKNIYIPNTQDFINAGTITTDDKVYITKDLLETIKDAGAVNITIDSEGDKNKVYAKGDMTAALMNSDTLKSADLSHLDISEATAIRSMFQNDKNLENVNIAGWNMGQFSDVSQMFSGAEKLVKVDLSDTVYKNGVNAWNFFAYNNALTDVDLTNARNITREIINGYVQAIKNSNATAIDLTTTTLNSNVTNLELLFSSIPNVKSINLSGWDTSRVTNIYATFFNDESLESVNISGWNLSNAESIASLFYGDSNLSNIDLSNVNFGNNIGDNSVSFAYVGNKLSNVNLTNAKGIPEAVLRAWVQAAKNTKATELSMSTFTVSEGITNLSNLFQGLSYVETIDLTGLNTSNVTDMSYMFANDPELVKIIGLEAFDTKNVTNMSNMFADYKSNTVNNNEPKGFSYFGKLMTLDLSNWDTSKVTNMSFMFTGQQNLTQLKGLDKWDTSNVTNMSHMFDNLSSLPDSELTNLNWDTSKVTDMSYMFSETQLQKDLSFVNKWNTSNVTDMSYMFFEDSQLTDLDLSNWDVSKVGTKKDAQNYSLADMFFGDTSLTTVGDISKWNTHNVHSIRDMFYGTYAMKSIDLSGWDTSSLSIAGELFRYTGASIINISNWDLSNLKHYNVYGFVKADGEYHGTTDMFRNLINKAVILMNNVTLPSSTNAFIVTDFAGNKPIAVIANDKNGNELTELTALNRQTWTDGAGNTIIGRQNSNVLTYVDVSDHSKTLGKQSLDFIYINANQIFAEINNDNKTDQVNNVIGENKRNWNVEADTENGQLKNSLRLQPAAGDTFWADWMTPVYQLNLVAPTISTETRTPTRTIIVTNPDGTIVTEVQTVTFTRKVTTYQNGTKEYGNWDKESGTWPEYNVPIINGYTASQSQVAAKAVNIDTPNETVEISYRANSDTPVIPDTPIVPDNPVTPDTPQPQPDDNQNVQPKPEEVPGSDNRNQGQKDKASSSETNSKDNSKTIAPKATTITKFKKSKAINSKAENTHGTYININKKTTNSTNVKVTNKNDETTLPQTGESQNKLAAVGLGLVSLLTFGLITDRKRRN